MRPSDRSAADGARALASGDLTSQAWVEDCLAAVARADGDLHAFLHVAADEARAAARASDRRRAGGSPLGPMDGVPIAIKDNLCTRDMPTTCGSRILAGYRPPYDAEVVRRLREAGLVLLGKTNMDEFGMGSSTENSAFGPTRNPANREYVPGGSSGGSAAAVSAGMVPLALGSDTGGSIRQPAAFCGCVGLKPTYGRVSRYGLVAFASSLDQVGPLARTVEDVAWLLQQISGYDSRDSTSSSTSVPDFTVLSRRDVAGMRFGIPQEYFHREVAPAVSAAIHVVADRLTDEGAQVVPTSLPHTKYGIAAYYLVAPSEASSNLARFDGVHYGLREGEDAGLTAMYSRSRGAGFGAEVKRRIMLGAFALSSGYYDAYYLRALRVRRRIRADFDKALSDVDLLLTPTSPFPAFPLGTKIEDPLSLYLCDTMTVGASLAGLPAISAPCGRTRTGLPIGLQLIGRPLDEATVLRGALAVEEVAG